jgi:hypothetical protein
MEQHDSPRGPCGLRTGRSALLAAGVLVAGVLATAAPTSAAHADGCNTGCGYGGWAGYGCNTGCGYGGGAGYTHGGYGGWAGYTHGGYGGGAGYTHGGYGGGAGYTHGGYGGYGCNTGCGYGGYGGYGGYPGYPGYTGYTGYTGYPGHHVPEYAGMLPGRAGIAPFVQEGPTGVVGSAEPEPSVEGESVTLHADVSCFDTDLGLIHPDGGTVTWTDTATGDRLTSAPVLGGVADQTMQGGLGLPEGVYDITASYNGDGCAPAVGLFAHTVEAAPPLPPPGPGNVNNNHQHQSQSQSVVVIIGGHAFRVHPHHAKMTAAVAPAAPSAPLPVTG